MGGLHRVSRENLVQLHTWKFKAARNWDGIGRREEKYEKMDLISRVCLHLHLRSLTVRGKVPLFSCKAAKIPYLRERMPQRLRTLPVYLSTCSPLGRGLFSNPETFLANNREPQSHKPKSKPSAPTSQKLPHKQVPFSTPTQTQPPW